MQLKDTGSRFGSIAQFFHWIVAVLVLTQYYLVYWTEWVLPKKSPQAIFYISGLHKPIGVLLLLLIFLAFCWRVSNSRPTFPSTMAKWEKIAAHLTHMLLALCVLVMAMSGLIMSTAAGYPPNFFGLYQIPTFISANKALSQLCFNIHVITSYALISLIGLHVLAALKHHFIDKDPVLKRMLP